MAQQNQQPNPEKQSQPAVEDIFDFEGQGNTPVPEQAAQPERQAAPEQQPAQPREREPQPGQAPETKPEQQTEGEQDRRQSAPPPADQAGTAEQAPAQPKDPKVVHIENVLSEHLDEIFMQMTPQQQMAFQQKGEETAQEINTLLYEAKVKVRKIITLIRDWLQMIPGVNKFFIEQEAKIKTDRLLNWREQQQKEK